MHVEYVVFLSLSMDRTTSTIEYHQSQDYECGGASHYS